MITIKTRFRWVRHSVEGLRLFFDIIYDADETCTDEQEIHVKEIDLPTPVLKMIAGRKIPEIPEEIREASQNAMGDRK